MTPRLDDCTKKIEELYRFIETELSEQEEGENDGNAISRD